MSSRSALASNFSRIASQVLFSKQIISPYNYIIRLPGGFCYEAYNAQACVNPWSLLRMVECGRGACFNPIPPDCHSFLDVAEMYKNYFIFIASTSTTISPKLYNVSTVKGPLILDVKLDYVGTKTIKMKTVMHLEGTDEPLCENNTQSVLVDNSTRKPSAPPDWWIQKYSLGSNNGTPLKLEPLQLPKDTKLSEYAFTVAATDVDSYLHVNWSNFVKYFYNTFLNFELKKVGRDHASLAFRNLKSFDVAYIKEANIDDNLVIKHWPVDKSEHIHNFQMFKKSQVISECKFEFFP
ncbi:uncharacterized protein LOC131944288 [Physella acuta]|uniref:uncharacterized protein LOC131944288 n=1 Tax=Physella acuta TaxID=109671 RepID=UPI0027DB9410|nr:uncharacterized protein LOC131944288 [Physella acuta]XP_059160830.1 uncharacterized protein LOC131944288 [Physella acuta]